MEPRRPQMIIERVPEAWAQFQMHVGGLSRPHSEEEYEQIISLMHHISDSYSTTSEPYAGLFDYLATLAHDWEVENEPEDRKSTRLNSSHVAISYAVFCLKKKTVKTHSQNLHHIM